MDKETEAGIGQVKALYGDGKGWIGYPFIVEDNKVFDENSPKNESNKTFACSMQMCTKMFRSRKHLFEHEHTHINIKPYSCSFCSKTATSQGNLNTHEKSQHLKSETFGKENQQLHFMNKPFYCQHCAITYKQRCYLDEQEREHWQVFLYSCSYCGKTSTRKCEYPKKLDLNIRAYCCSDCFFWMNTEWSLDYAGMI